MNRGLIRKTVRDVWLGTLLFGIGIAGFEALLAYIGPTVFAESSGQLLQLEFVQTMLKGLLGADIGDVLNPRTLSAFAWVHPIVLALLWAHEITFWTRMPAGEIDRGTIDVLLSFPVSRTRIYCCETLVWLVAGLAVILMGLAGNLIGFQFLAPEFRSEMPKLLAVVSNAYCLYLAVGGVAALVSTLSDHRGRAVGVIFGIVLASFLLNFLAQFWTPAGHVSFLSFLDYYRPLLIFRDSSWPLKDMAILIAIGTAFWAAGLAVFVRRDICTV